MKTHTTHETHPLRRQTALTSAAALLGLFLLPAALLREPAQAAAELPEAPILLPVEEAPPSSNTAAIPDRTQTLRVLDGDAVTEMTLAEYLVGVTAAEMPASFAPEALKAQAVAARTYTLCQLRAGERHGETADICTDPACCQAFVSMERARDNWGADAESYEATIRAAVTDTDGEVILYDGAPILAVFHASSAGLTRAAGQVWQSDLPYLQPVDSPEAGDTVPDYYSRAEFSPSELRKKLLVVIPSADFSGSTGDWLSNARRDSAGSVETLDVGGITVRGTAVRAALGLRSACFEWEIQDGTFVFYVTGHGHGVGLSQYGANTMAKNGADYKTILTHYYTGVTVTARSG